MLQKGIDREGWKLNTIRRHTAKNPNTDRHTKTDTDQVLWPLTNLVLCLLSQDITHFFNSYSLTSLSKCSALSLIALVTKQHKEITPIPENIRHT